MVVADVEKTGGGEVSTQGAVVFQRLAGYLHGQILNAGVNRVVKVALQVQGVRGGDVGLAEADVYAYQVRKRGDDILFRVRTLRYDREFRLTMPGLFNVENALGVSSSPLSSSVSTTRSENFPDTSPRSRRRSRALRPGQPNTEGAETRQKRGREYVDVPSDVEYVNTFLQEYDNTHSLPSVQAPERSSGPNR